MTKYLDTFVKTPGYLCNTAPDAPIVFENGIVVDLAVEAARKQALALSQAERVWKDAIVAAIESPDADRLGLPRYSTIAANSSAGGATTVSMIAAWRVAKHLGILKPSEFDGLCQNQLRLLRTENERADGKVNQAGMFRDMLDEYEKRAP